MKRFLLAVVALFASALWLAPASAQDTPQAGGLTIKKLGEKKVASLPAGDLYWLIENFGSLADAKAAAGEYSLPVESAGKSWLFTLGSKGNKGKGARVAEVGPIAPIKASEYLLRINEASAPPGAKTEVHSHPGSEAFYVLAGESSVRGPHGVTKVGAGKAEAGHGPDMPMEVTSTGSGNLLSLVMFVLDANRPFMKPEKF